MKGVLPVSDGPAATTPVHRHASPVPSPHPRVPISPARVTVSLPVAALREPEPDTERLPISYTPGHAARLLAALRGLEPHEAASADAPHRPMARRRARARSDRPFRSLPRPSVAIPRRPHPAQHDGLESKQREEDATLQVQPWGAARAARAMGFATGPLGTPRPAGFAPMEEAAAVAAAALAEGARAAGTPSDSRPFSAADAALAAAASDSRAGGVDVGVVMADGAPPERSSQGKGEKQRLEDDDGGSPGKDDAEEAGKGEAEAPGSKERREPSSAPASVGRRRRGLARRRGGAKRRARKEVTKAKITRRSAPPAKELDRGKKPTRVGGARGGAAAAAAAAASKAVPRQRRVVRRLRRQEAPRVSAQRPPKRRRGDSGGAGHPTGRTASVPPPGLPTGRTASIPPPGLPAGRTASVPPPGLPVAEAAPVPLSAAAAAASAAASAAAPARVPSEVGAALPAARQRRRTATSRFAPGPPAPRQPVSAPASVAGDDLGGAAAFSLGGLPEGPRWPSAPPAAALRAPPGLSGRWQGGGGYVAAFGRRRTHERLNPFLYDRRRGSGTYGGATHGDPVTAMGVDPVVWPDRSGGPRLEGDGGGEDDEDEMDEGGDGDSRDGRKSREATEDAAV